MGLSIGAFIIRQHAAEFSAKDIVLFYKGAGFTELSESTLNAKVFDTRKPTCIAVYKNQSFITIVSTDLTTRFYDRSSNDEIIKKTYQYFRKPRQVFAFEEYDSGDTYGFSIVTDGKVERYYRYINERTETFGDPLNIELKLFNAKRFTETNVHGDINRYFTHPDTGKLYNVEELPMVLLYEVMQHEVGMTPDDVYNNATERTFFMKM